METIKLPNGPTLDFYTVKEKKPNHGDQVIFIRNCNTTASFAVGYYKNFKSTQGRFVSEVDGSWVESGVLYWAYKYIKI
jgi:hypothetical protein